MSSSRFSWSEILNPSYTRLVDNCQKKQRKDGNHSTTTREYNVDTSILPLSIASHSLPKRCKNRELNSILSSIMPELAGPQSYTKKSHVSNGPKSASTPMFLAMLDSIKRFCPTYLTFARLLTFLRCLEAWNSNPSSHSKNSQTPTSPIKTS